MAGQEGNRTLKQDQVQKFLDHAAKVHDTKVLNGEKSNELFPKPVYEESPYDQREKVILEARRKFQENITSLIKMETFDVPRYNALCRGEELRVSLQYFRFFGREGFVSKDFPNLCRVSYVMKICHLHGFCVSDFLTFSASS